MIDLDVYKIWDVDGEIAQIYNTTWSVGKEYMLKKSNKYALENNLSFLQRLEVCEIPVAQPVAARSGELLVVSDESCYLMTKRLKGTHITNIYESDYRTIAHETGLVAARLHKAFIKCESLISQESALFIEELEGWIYTVLESDRWEYVSKDEYQHLVGQMRDCYDLLPKQLIHRDLHYGNMLFDNMIFTGYIDFDLSKKDARIFDLCYFLLSLLIDHNTAAELAIWTEIIHSFIAGYEELLPLASIEKESIPLFMQCIELLFVAYFHQNGSSEFKHNAAKLYECIRVNEELIKRSVR